MAEQIGGQKIFIATCPHTDPEMDERIRRHRQDRQGRGWQTVEEPVQLTEQLRSFRQGYTVLVDCLTLWVNNLMYAAGQENSELTEDQAAEAAQQLADTASSCTGTVILVTNETGSGIVPDNAMARYYRDLVGRCNQVIAGQADQVFLVTCGIARQIK